MVGGCLGARQASCRVLQALRRKRDHQVANGLLVLADQLAHDPEPAVDGDRPAGGCRFAGDQPQQGALADTVRPDQCHAVAVADAEVDVVQQLGAARTSPSNVADLDRSHSGCSRYATVPPECRGVTLKVMLQKAQPPSTLPQANDACWCGSGRKYKRCHKPLEGRVMQGVVSPRRPVPDHIGRPPYAESGVPVRWAESRVKTPEIIARMRHAGIVAAEVLRLAGEKVAPGVTTDEIDVFVHDLCIERNSYPSPLNYNHFPKSVCTSVNEVICHGIPDSRPLQDGDIINIDVTTYVGGVHGDTNATFFVGNVDPASQQLVRVTEECMWHGIEAVRPGRPISDIGKAIEAHAKKHKYGVVRAFIGHGIGEQFHTDIQVLHYYDERANIIMRPGMTFTIEPMITMGSWQHKMVFDDNWTAITSDGRRTAQYEHTILVTDDGYDVLTAPGAVSPSAPWHR